VTTGEPAGTVLHQGHEVSNVKFCRQGRGLVSSGRGIASLLWDVAFLWEKAEPSRVLLEARVRSGLRLGTGGDVATIPAKEWRALRDDLDKTR
jgi:hypothetical protein